MAAPAGELRASQTTTVGEMVLFMLFLFVSHERRITETQFAARRTSVDLGTTQGDLADLRAAVDRLALVNQASWELLRERTNLSDADLEKRVREVDLRDGRLDGRLGKVMNACDQCGRPNRSDRARCLYCDAAL